MEHMYNFVFNVYPYIGLSIFFLGCLIRYDREQYTWKSDSSQLLYHGQLRIGSYLFHIGIILLFCCHLVGLLTPMQVYTSMGLPVEIKQKMAIGVGFCLGAMIWTGLLILLHRRLFRARIRKTSKKSDILVLVWLFVTVSLGLSTLPDSAAHLNGVDMERLANWAQTVVTFGENPYQYMADVPPVYKVHMFFGMTLFIILPFTRLVHIWSGFATPYYLIRPRQIVREK